MKSRVLTLMFLATLSCVSHAASVQQESGSVLARATAQAEKITDVDALITQTDQWVHMASNGVYGPMKHGDLKRLEAARDTVYDLLNGHASPRELRSDELVALYNAQESITAILKKDDKNRMVCKREAKTGSRLWGTECMTVAEREARARIASENTGTQQRLGCSVGETSTCAK